MQETPTDWVNVIAERTSMKNYFCYYALRPLRCAAAVAVAPTLLSLPLLTGAPPRVAIAAPILQGAATKASAAVTQRTFIYTPAPGGADVKSVSVAGTFNNWDKNALPMTQSADGASWRVTTALPYGKHQYKFVVNGETWLADPRAAKNEDDGGGNVNSVLLVLPPEYDKPARIGDGVITQSALQHVQAPPYLNYDRGQITLSLRVRSGDISSVSAVFLNRSSLPMTKVSEDDFYALYQVRAPWNRADDLHYAFTLADGKTNLIVSANGVISATSLNSRVKDGNIIKPFALNAKTFKPFVTPSWVERSVFYQIFPDRFENGSETNDPKDVEAWDAKPTYFNRFGGDAVGVEKHVDYLAALGVGAVYFNPVFQSPSNHRYDATDYKKIDPQFGTNAEFARLSRSLQTRGIRTVMDFVFNHSATNFFAFQDIQDKGEASTYKDWYFVQSYPVKVEDKPNYTAWYGFPSMPKFNVLNPPTHEYLLSLVDYWKKELPLAGMRLDVANEVDPRFWRDLRVKAKTLDPNLWIVGEVWGDGSPWLKGDQWDSVMNYQFRDSCLRFFAEEKTTPTQFASRLTALDASYAPQVSRNMMNLLSSHDTPRFLTLCKNDAQMHRLAATLQFTWVGAPSIYYGEELGMQGGADPDNRRPMQWQTANAANPMLAYYKKLIAVRNANPALQSGDARILLTDDKAGTLAFSRELGNKVAVVVLNRSRVSRTVTIPLRAATKTAAPSALRSTAFADALSGKRFMGRGGSLSVTMTLAPLTGAILVPAR